MRSLSASASRRVSDDVVALLRARYPVETLETIETGVMTIGSHGDVPTDYIENGEYRGIHGEVRRRIAEILGLAVKPIEIVWPEMLGRLEHREIDVPGVGTGWTPDRSRTFRFTAPFQYFFYGVAEATSREPRYDIDALQGRVTSAEDQAFNNDELAALLGTDKLLLRATAGEVIDDLLEGRCEVAVYDFPVIRDLLAQLPEAESYPVVPFRFNQQYPLTTGRFPCYVVFHDDAVTLHAAAELALDALKTSGELEAIYSSHGFGPDRLVSIGDTQ